jgi:hypothetical protein
MFKVNLKKLPWLANIYIAYRLYHPQEKIKHFMCPIVAVILNVHKAVDVRAQKTYVFYEGQALLYTVHTS